MKLEDLKLGQEVTIYKYYFNSYNDIKVSELNYYVHNIQTTDWNMFDKKEHITKSYKHTVITLYALKPYDYEPHSLEMKVEEGDKFENHSDELWTALYSLNNDEETLNNFKIKSNEVLIKQMNEYKVKEDLMHKEYLKRVERLNKLILNSDSKDKSE